MPLDDPPEERRELSINDAIHEFCEAMRQAALALNAMTKAIEDLRDRINR